MSGSNGHMRELLPPLSLSILGLEPLDEFIKEIADFIHHMIVTRPDMAGNVEVEAKIGILRDKATGQRLALPVLVESSTSFAHMFGSRKPMCVYIVLVPDFDCRFESNMSVVRSCLHRSRT